MNLRPDLWFRVFRKKEPLVVDMSKFKDLGGGVLVLINEDGSQSDTMIIDGQIGSLIGCVNGDTCCLADIENCCNEYENNLEKEARKYLRAEIRKWLQFYDISHEELARKINYSKDAVDKFLSGKRDSKNVEAAIKKFLNIDENIGKVSYDDDEDDT